MRLRPESDRVKLPADVVLPSYRQSSGSGPMASRPATEVRQHAITATLNRSCCVEVLQSAGIAGAD